jgi:thioredoxin 2
VVISDGEVVMIRPCPRCGSQNRVPAGRLHQRAHCGSCKSPLLPLDAPYVAESADQFDEIVRESSLPVVVDFWAPWCGPCRMVAPELEKLARSKAGAVVVAKVNTDELPQVAGRFGIRGIPTLIRFDRGRETRRVSGAMNAAALSDQLGI